MAKCDIKGCRQKARVFSGQLKFCKEHAKEIGWLVIEREA